MSSYVLHSVCTVLAMASVHPTLQNDYVSQHPAYVAADISG